MARRRPVFWPGRRSETSIEDVARPVRRANVRAWPAEKPRPPALAIARRGRGCWPDHNKCGRDSARWPGATFADWHSLNVAALIAHHSETGGKAVKSKAAGRARADAGTDWPE